MNDALSVWPSRVPTGRDVFGTPCAPIGVPAVREAQVEPTTRSGVTVVGRGGAGSVAWAVEDASASAPVLAAPVAGDEVAAKAGRCGATGESSKPALVDSATTADPSDGTPAATLETWS